MCLVRLELQFLHIDMSLVHHELHMYLVYLELQFQQQIMKVESVKDTDKMKKGEQTFMGVNKNSLKLREIIATTSSVITSQSFVCHHCSGVMLTSRL